MAAITLAVALVSGGAEAGGGPQPDEPDEYRMSAFRAPVPATLLDADVLSAEDAAKRWEAGGALFIDVLPRPPRPKSLPEGTIWNDKPRDSIPGARWFPNVGFGRLSEERTAYFRDGLARLTEGDSAASLIIFCQEMCWMSWNAARRAILEFGYTNVAWYPDGSDGWSALGRELERIEPEE
ncbi:MAG: PQQ-dependent catabolism-associated CXXCW motif protein [Pseudomonadota bacterium]